VAGGAEIADKNVVRPESGGEELRAIGFFQVQEYVFGRGLVAWRHPIEPLDGIGFLAGAEFVKPVGSVGELGVELRGKFGADFVAAAADGGADGREEIGGPRAKVHMHFPDGFDDDAGEGAAPPGVDGGYGAILGVHEENGDAVGCLDPEKEPGTVSGGGVAFRGLLRGGVEVMDDVGVDLFERDELKIAGAERSLEAAAVFEDVFASVPIGEAEIQNFLAIERTGAAGLGAEPVD